MVHVSGLSDMSERAPTAQLVHAVTGKLPMRISLFVE